MLILMESEILPLPVKKGQTEQTAHLWSLKCSHEMLAAGSLSGEH